MKIMVATIFCFTLLFNMPILLAQNEKTEEVKPEKKQQQKKVKKIKKRESCYQLGYRYGKCFTLSFAGLPCDPKDDIAIPPECRNNEEKDRGVKAGTAEIYRKLGLR